jgi:hypothetical protein
MAGSLIACRATYFMSSSCGTRGGNWRSVSPLIRGNWPGRSFLYLYTISSMRTRAAISFHKKLPSVFTYTEAIARGLPEIDQNLLEIAYRIPKGTLCLTTALARHGLTDSIPTRIDVAVPRGHRIPVLQSPVDIRVFAKDTFEFGARGVQSRGGLRCWLVLARALASRHDSIAAS